MNFENYTRHLKITTTCSYIKRVALHQDNYVLFSNLLCINIKTKVGLTYRFNLSVPEPALICTINCNFKAFESDSSL